MPFVVCAMAARISAAGETAGEGSGQQLGWDRETVEQLKFALAEACGLRPLRFFFHIVAIMLQEQQKKQAISECENRTRFLECLSLRRKRHPSRGTHAWWHRPSEIAGLPEWFAPLAPRPPRPMTCDEMVGVALLRKSLTRSTLKRQQSGATSAGYCTFAYSALASLRMGTSGPASFHSVKKSL